MGECSVLQYCKLRGLGKCEKFVAECLPGSCLHVLVGGIAPLGGQSVADVLVCKWGKKI
jgi:hypothetical protein